MYPLLSLIAEMPYLCLSSSLNFLLVSSWVDTNHCHSITESDQSEFFVIVYQQHHAHMWQHKIFISTIEYKIFNWYLAV